MYVYIYRYVHIYIHMYIYIYLFIDTCYFVSCFSVIQQMPLGDIPVTIWLDAVIFSRSFATFVSLLSLMIFASGDVVCAVHEYGPSLRHEGHLTLIREQKVYLRFLRIWRTTLVTGNCCPHSAWNTRCSLGAAAMQVGTVAPSERSCSGCSRVSASYDCRV